MNLKLRGIQTGSNIHFTSWVECFEVLIHIAYQAANLTLIGETNFDIFVNLYMILLKKSKITMTQCSDNEWRIFMYTCILS